MKTDDGSRLDAEKDELEFLLTSGVVDPDSNPGKLLRYLCERYFESADADLKERNIAVDVFHRSPNFDKRSDSIVRVEAYRLRKRLADFYSGPGRDRPIRILIPTGRYAPVVEPNTPGQPTSLPGARLEPQGNRAGQELQEIPIRTLAPLSKGRTAPGGSRRLLIGAIASALVMLGIGLAARSVLTKRPGRIEASPARIQPADGAAIASPESEVRVLAGYTRDRYVDRRGRVWLGDRYFHGGNMSDPGPAAIQRAFDPTLFQTLREGLDFSYNIPAKPGKYELRLYFSEFHFGSAPPQMPGGENYRLMNVSLNGAPLLHMFDVLSEADGSGVAHIRSFRDVSPASDGMVHVRFEAVSDRAFVNAIELIPQGPSGAYAVRMVARLSAFIDKSGALWQPDDYVVGGRLVDRNEPVSGAGEAELYEGERYGHFNYAIPLPKGKYTLRLHFAEAWFKQPGSRVFHVLTDGRALLHDFDIIKEAGAPRVAVIREFHNLEPNAQGLLNLSFVPVTNYALVNAIEVRSE